MGGHTENPTYQDVCTDKTGHVEVVHISYDAAIISYTDLLSVFWNNHDPTSWDLQNGDTGTQYRSVIFYHSLAQKNLAEKSIHELEINNAYDKPIVTVIRQANEFYRAEDYHQHYYQKTNK